MLCKVTENLDKQSLFSISSKYDIFYEMWYVNKILMFKHFKLNKLKKKKQWLFVYTNSHLKHNW